MNKMDHRSLAPPVARRRKDHSGLIVRALVLAILIGAIAFAYSRFQQTSESAPFSAELMNGDAGTVNSGVAAYDQMPPPGEPSQPADEAPATQQEPAQPAASSYE